MNGHVGSGRTAGKFMPGGGAAAGALTPGANETGRAVPGDDAPGFAALLKRRISGESAVPARYGQHPPAWPC